MYDLVAPLAGVLVGGLLAIAGQILGSVVNGRAERRRERAMIKAAARLQQHSYWFFQEASAGILRKSVWPSFEIDERYMPTRDDMRLLSGLLEPEAWRLYSTAIRLQLEVMRDMRESVGKPLTREDSIHIFSAYVCAGAARTLISRTSGVIARAHDPGSLALDEEQIRSALAHPLLVGEAEKWIQWLHRA